MSYRTDIELELCQNKPRRTMFRMNNGRLLFVDDLPVGSTLAYDFGDMCEVLTDADIHSVTAIVEPQGVHGTIDDSEQLYRAILLHRLQLSNFAARYSYDSAEVDQSEVATATKLCALLLYWYLGSTYGPNKWFLVGDRSVLTLNASKYHTCQYCGYKQLGNASIGDTKATDQPGHCGNQFCVSHVLEEMVNPRYHREALTYDDPDTVRQGLTAVQEVCDDRSAR
jgi:hypothetical protein